MTLLLDRSAVAHLISMEETLTVVEKAFGELQGGTAIVPHREQILLSDQDGDCFFMPAYLESDGAFGIKVSPFYLNNSVNHDLPRVIDIVLLLDNETGQTLAIMDAHDVTAFRTGAVCGIASKYLAREDAEVVALIGMGTQARTQIEAICAVQDVALIKASSKRPHTHTTFAREMSQRLDVPIEIEESVQAAVQDADIVLLATSSTDPVLHGKWIAPGTHVSSILSVGPEAREVDTSLVERSKVICDSSEACLEEAGELLIPIREGKVSPKDIYADLGELVSGLKQGRENQKEVTFFKSVGLAIQDIATAKYIYQKAEQKGVGERFEFLS